MEGKLPWGDNWQVKRLHGRAPQFVGADDLPVHRQTRAFLGHHKNGIYVHQRSALEGFMRGEDV